MCVQRHKHASVTKSSRYCGHLIKFDGSFLNDEVKWKELLKGGVSEGVWEYGKQATKIDGNRMRCKGEGIFGRGHDLEECT